ncbi:MAG: hypothetical protein ABI408_11835 [Gemmatimonadaceae bacterium]
MRSKVAPRHIAAMILSPIAARGMLADLAVLSQDIFLVPAASLPATQAYLTMVGGKIVYDSRTTRGAK